MLGQCECGCGGLTAVAAKSRPKTGIVKGQPRRYIHGHSLKGNGKDSVCWKGDSVGSAAAHIRLGKAKDHMCSSCLYTPAQDWSFNPETPVERRKMDLVKGQEYSTDPQDYTPLCRLCHRQLDAQALRKKRTEKITGLPKEITTTLVHTILSEIVLGPIPFPLATLAAKHKVAKKLIRLLLKTEAGKEAIQPCLDKYDALWDAMRLLDGGGGGIPAVWAAYNATQPNGGTGQQNVA